MKNIFMKKPPLDTNTENPYLNARRTWNSHVGSVVERNQLAIFVCLISLLIALTAVGGMAYIGSQSKFIPLVFEQDSSGNTISMTRADHIPDVKVDDYRTAVADFVNNIRTVTPDVELQRKAVLKVYNYLAPNDPATAKATDFLNGTKDSNPFERAKTETVSVQLKSALQQSQTTWQVEWLETVRDRDGSLKGSPYLMRALITIYQNKDAQVTQDHIFENPHYIFVKDFNWSKQL